MAINNVTLTGRLTGEPDCRYSTTGMAITNFTLAVDRPPAKDGSKQADFPRCICFNKTAELAANHLNKGSLVGVEGRIQTGKYEGRDGVTRYTTDVIVNRIHFLSSKPKQQDDDPPLDTSGLGLEDGDLPF